MGGAAVSGFRQSESQMRALVTQEGGQWGAQEGRAPLSPAMDPEEQSIPFGTDALACWFLLYILPGILWLSYDVGTIMEFYLQNTLA